jgi:hypothetical protein
MQLRLAFRLSLFLLAVPLKSHAASPASSKTATPSSVTIVELFTRKDVQAARQLTPSPADQSEADERGPTHRRNQ